MKKSLSFMAGEIIDSKLYFSANEFNGLYVYDFNSQKCEYVCEFLNEPWETYYTHCKCIKHGKLLIFIPRFGTCINIYDTATGIQKSISIRDKQIYRDCYGEAAVYKDELWIFSKHRSVPTIIMNLNNFVIREINVINEWCDANIKGTETILCTRIVLESDWVWMAPYGSNKVIKFNLDNNDIVSYDVEDAKFFGIFDGGTNLWVSEKIGSRIFKIDKNLTNTEKLMINDGYDENDRCISQIIDLNGNIYIMPFQKGDVLLVNGNEKSFTKAFTYPICCRYQKLAFLNYCRDKENVYFFPLKNDGILKYNHNKNEVEFHPTYVECDEDMSEKFLARRIKADKYVVENRIYGLDTFIKYLKR